MSYPTRVSYTATGYPTKYCVVEILSNIPYHPARTLLALLLRSTLTSTATGARPLDTAATAAAAAAAAAARLQLQRHQHHQTPPRSGSHECCGCGCSSSSCSLPLPSCHDGSGTACLLEGTIDPYTFIARRSTPPLTIACPLGSPVRNFGSPRDLWRGEKNSAGSSGVLLERGGGVRAILLRCARSPCASKSS